MTGPTGPERRAIVNRQATPQDRMRAVHADAYPSWPDGDPVCATCHNPDCPRYWRIQNRLDQQTAARRAAHPVEPGPAAGWWEETPAEAADADRRYWNRDED